MRLPFNGRNRMTSPYGTRVLNGVAGWHAGIDLVGDDDKTVHSVCAGTVYSSTMVAKSSGDLTWQWGNYVCVKGDDGRYYYYCHLASRAVAKGARVKEGDVLGVMGNTGYSFGAHTHFEVRKSDRRTTLNAADALGIKNTCGTYEQDKPAMLPTLDPTKPMRLTVTAANCEIFGAMDVAAPLGKLPKDTVYDVVEYYPAEVLLGSLRGNWVKIKTANDETYYCLALNDRTSLANVWQPAVGDTIRTTATLNVRSAPNTSRLIVDRLAKSTTVTLAEVADGWGYVKGKGWISLAYTKAV